MNQELNRRILQGFLLFLLLAFTLLFNLALWYLAPRGLAQEGNRAGMTLRFCETEPEWSAR